MNRWAYVFLAAAAMGAAAVAVTVALRRAQRPEGPEEILEDCFDRLRRIEVEIQRLKPQGEPAG